MPKAGPLSPVFDKYEPPGTYEVKSLRRLLEALAAREVESGWHYFHVAIGAPVQIETLISDLWTHAAFGQLSIVTVLSIPEGETYEGGLVINFDGDFWMWLAPGYFYVDPTGQVEVTLTVPAMPSSIGVALASGQATPTDVGAFLTAPVFEAVA